MALKPPPAPRGSAAPRLPAPPQPPPSWTAPRSGAAHSGLAGRSDARGTVPDVPGLHAPAEFLAHH